MTFDFDLGPFEIKCFISDMEWQMIIQSGSFMKLGKCNYAVYRNHVLTFIIRENGLIELLNKRRIPCKNYVLPIVTNTMNYSQRVNAYLEQSRISKGVELDAEHFLKYGT